MKIKKFKVTPRIKNVYSNLKQNGINITPEIETLVNVMDKKISEVMVPSLLLETFDIADEKVKHIISFLNLPQNTSNISFILVTLGKEVEIFLKGEEDNIKKSVVESLLTEHISASVMFAYKLLQEQVEEDYELSSVFTPSEEICSEIISLVKPERIGIEYNTGVFSPIYSSINYLFWFNKKRK